MSRTDWLGITQGSLGWLIPINVLLLFAVNSFKGLEDMVKFRWNTAKPGNDFVKKCISKYSRLLSFELASQICKPGKKNETPDQSKNRWEQKTSLSVNSAVRSVAGRILARVWDCTSVALVERQRVWKSRSFPSDVHTFRQTKGLTLNLRNLNGFLQVKLSHLGWRDMKTETVCVEQTWTAHNKNIFPDSSKSISVWFKFL